MSQWLVIDADNICSVAFHSTGRLAEGTLFGFFRAVATLQQRFRADGFVFCFDRQPTARLKLLPGYKATRKAKRREWTPEEKAAYRDYRRQKDSLCDTHLRRCGYRNVFFAEGLEADDCIASVTKGLPESDEAIIVSSDSDLLQLINARVQCYSPVTHNLTTLQGFKAKYGVSPSFWADVKAMAGCSSDDVAGIKGIGEKRACQFLARELKPESKAHQAITANTGVWQTNLELTRLPFHGTPQFELREDRATPERWRRVMDELGLDSLRDFPPPGRRPKPKPRGKYAKRRRVE